MIVKDAEDIEKARQMLREHSPLVYSDEHTFLRGISDADKLENLCFAALERGSFAVVEPASYEPYMESWHALAPIVRKQRTKEERQKVKEWMRANPQAVEKVEKHLKKG
jgi:hypothetical protein